MARVPVDARECLQGPFPSWSSPIAAPRVTERAAACRAGSEDSSYVIASVAPSCSRNSPSIRGPCAPYRSNRGFARSKDFTYASAHRLLSGNDSAWADVDDTPSSHPTITAPARSFDKLKRSGEFHVGTKLVESVSLGGRNATNGRGVRRGRLSVHLPALFQKHSAPHSCKSLGAGQSGLIATGSGVASLSSYGMCLLTFKDPKLEEQFRVSRLIRRKAPSVCVSFLFLIVLSSLWPVYGKVLSILRVSEELSFSFSVGCGTLIGAWTIHACIVLFRKKLRIGGKSVLRLTLVFVALTLLLALAWVYFYLGSYLVGQKQQLRYASVEALAAPNSAAEGVEILPTSQLAYTSALVQEGPLVQSSLSSSAPNVGITTPLVPVAGVLDSAKERIASASSMPQEKKNASREVTEASSQPTHIHSTAIGKGAESFIISSFVTLLLMTLSIIAVYSLTDFCCPILYMAFLIYAVVWGCGFANRYAVNRHFEEKPGWSLHTKIPSNATAVEHLQQLARTALQLLTATRVASAEKAAPYVCEGLFVQLQAALVELSTTLSETDDLYSSRIMQSLMDTAAGQRWLSAIRLRGSSLREDMSGSPDTSFAETSASFAKICPRVPSSREIVYSSCLLEDGPWQKLLGSMTSSARCSGSDLYRLPSEGIVMLPLSRADSPSFAAAASAAAGEGGSKLLKETSAEGTRLLSHAPCLSEPHPSLPEVHTRTQGDIEAALVAGVQEGIPSPPDLTSLVRSICILSRCQSRRHSSCARSKSAGGEQKLNIVDNMMEIQMAPLKELGGAFTKFRQASGELTGCRVSQGPQQLASGSLTQYLWEALRLTPSANLRLRALWQLISDARQLFQLPQGSMCLPDCFRGVGLEWDTDILTLAQNHQGMLQRVGWLLLRPFVQLLECGVTPILRLLQQIESRYDPDIPYHTATHAVQVAHAAMVLSTKLHLDSTNEDMGTFCLSLAALAHDVGHLGRTNGFLQQSRHPLATIYNDQSILENFHASILFRIITEIPSANIFCSQSIESYQSLRQQIIALILATDMKEHVDLVSRSRIRRNNPDFNFLRREEDALHVRKMVLKMADLSHALLCWKDHFIWTCKISEEFYRQGDAEKRLKLPVSSVCNRESHQCLAQNQVAFLRILVEPLLLELEGIEASYENEEPQIGFIRDTLRKRYESNVERWTALDNSGLYIIIDGHTPCTRAKEGGG
ncbi:calcium calmodulin-dependent 3 5 -cyclic nucleotide [Cyclospora cayetanensis]|uniref:Phosphodiesterase n=1 Tax=Cyclospora cayetanensis TaxID=88456 RepID=A0A1D3D029_9EIME|nr:calcium calmodulin-dependent 3 5 -cyclic nucleotide [Cyclospora cayetanensis]